MDLEQRLTMIEQRLHVLEGREGIRETIHRYARGVDDDDVQELSAIFAEDALMESRPWRATVYKGRDAIVDFFHKISRPPWLSPRRRIANERIAVQGTTGTAFAYWFVVQGHAATGQSYIGWGTYDFKFRLEEGIWKITHMKITVLAMTTLERGWGMEDGRVLPLPSSSKR